MDKKLYSTFPGLLKLFYLQFCLFVFVCFPLFAKKIDSTPIDMGVISSEARPVMTKLEESLQKIIKGTVTDNIGPLPGVSISVIGDTKGVVTHKNGNFTIDVNPTDELLFSFIGMELQTILGDNRTVINVMLSPNADALDEITAVAFGTQKKESAVSSITTINPNDLLVPSSNLTTALTGRLSSLIAYQRSDEPVQDNVDFFIRGVTSFGYIVSPFILIDGLEMRSEDLSRLKPDDIASFSILKDASATSLYGARGANGVIMVITKEGMEGKAQVSIHYKKSNSVPTRQLELANRAPAQQVFIKTKPPRADKQKK